MRISHIRIRNLASLAGSQPAIVLGPQGMAGGLVAVTGATGSGKSTILDCLCLALYGDTPRLSGRGEDRNATNILTRGAHDGFAEVDFLDDQGLQYRARWEIERSRKGTLKQPQMSLLCLDSQQQVARGVRETQQQVTQIIGLDRNQFVGVVLLAQGSFSTFVSGDVKDRGALLERLSGYTQYSRLGRAAHAYLAQAKAAVQKIEHQLGENPLLDAAGRQDLEARISQGEQEARSAQAQTEAASTFSKQLADCHAAWQGFSQASKQQQQDADALAALADQRALLANAERLETLRSPLGILDDRQQQLTAERQAQQRCQQQITSLASQCQSRQDRLTQALGQMHTFLQQLDQQYQAAKSQAPEDTELLRRLERVAQEQARAQASLRESQAKSQDIARQIPKLEQEVGQQRAVLEETQQQRAQNEQHLQDIRRRLEQAEQEGGDSEQRSAVLHGRQQLPQWLEQLQVLESTIARCQAEQEGLDGQAQGLRQQSAEQEQQIAQQAHSLEVARRLLVLAQSEASVSAHRHSLVLGEHCPLCLQELRSLPSAEDRLHPLPQAQAQVQALQEQLETQQTQAAQLQARLQTLPERRQHLIQQQEDSQQQQRLLTQRFVTLRQTDGALPAELAALSKEDCLQLIAAAQTALQELKDLRAQQTAAQEQVQARRDAEEQAQRHLHGLEQRYHSLQAQARERQDGQEQAQRQSAALTEELSGGLQRLAASLQEQAPPPEAAGRWLGSLRQALGRFQEWQQLQQRVSLRFAERLGEIQAELPAGCSLGAGSDSLAESAELASQQLEKSGKSIRQEHQAWQAAQQEQQQALSQLHSLSQRINSQQEELQQLQQQLAKACTQEGLSDIAALRAALLPREKITALRQRLGQAEEACLRSSSAQEAARKQLEQLHQACGPALAALDAPDFASQLAEVRQEAQIQQQQRQEEADRLRSSLASLRAEREQDERNRQRAGDLREQLEVAQAERQRIEQLHQLIGSHDGSKFRDLAQAFTLEQLVQHANHRLERFAPRYALRRRDGLALEVIDRDLADETRAVTTLSGGESFLVSLALALALADLKRGRAHIGTVFIDEGFGSLDSDSLENALAALAEVQADLGAQLVVISHVGDLAQRWDDIVRVQRSSRGRSWLQVPGGPKGPPKDSPPPASGIDTCPIRDWLATQSKPQSRSAIAQALGLANNAGLAQALKSDPEIILQGRSYSLKQAGHSQNP